MQKQYQESSCLDILNRFERQDLNQRGFSSNPFNELEQNLRENNLKFVDIEMPKESSWIRISDMRKQQICSKASDNKVEVQFISKLQYDCDLFWVDYQGLLQNYGKLLKQENKIIQTYTSHVWILQHNDVKITEYLVNNQAKQSFEVFESQQSDNNEEIQINCHSREWSQPVQIIFRNCCDHPCDIYWIDYNGKPQGYGQLQINEKKTQETFYTHVWVFKKGSKIIKIYEASQIKIQNIDIYPRTQNKIQNSIKDDIVIFPQYGVRAQDCIQGQIGNCWLHQSISAAAHDHPSEIQSLFTPQYIQQTGFYVIKFFCAVNSSYSYILIDDYIPMDGNRPKYAQFTNQKNQSQDSGIWVILLEKAYAKLQGGYEYLEAAKTKESCHQALQRFLGGESNYYNWHKDYQPIITVDELWKKIFEIKKNKKSISLSSAMHKSGQFIQHGIVDFHGYALFQIQEFQTKKGRVRLLQVRNTWGKTEWDGDWSDNSQLWKQNLEISQKLNQEKNDDGIFWISIEDFRKEFSILWWN